ncbi:hypothetical protein IW261DRAFT_1553160 [Armillaria novae-zelandiae]|uniref:ARM repeat-containing protein n=1 Tax=Armillaria novae-zelandiae TaxID=153914 RepID=A0AA39NXJ9_9AGAR|nr:hypothetical protein IW261DRAFT_1553160 [Armillaria novae-zelandiae]
MDKAVTHTFRSSLLEELEQSTNSLIEGEANMKKALGRLWEVISEDAEPEPTDASVVTKREDEDGDSPEDVDRARRIARAPDLTPPIHKLFLFSYSSEPPVHEPSHFASPETQQDNLERSIGVLRELQDDGREYVERLQEIREGLGEIKAQRNGVWQMVRERALKELQDAALMAVPDYDLHKLRCYAQSLPYAIESTSNMMELLDFIILRIVQCVEARDYDVGLLQWDSMLSYYWTMLKYPIPKEKRIPLAKIYFYASTIPGMSTQMVAMCSDAFKLLTKSKKRISIKDMRLPWRPIYDILKQDLFLSRRQFEYTQLSWCMGYMAENSRRFFHPAAIDEMLSTFVPQFNGTDLDSVLSSQYYLLTFLPLSHPQSYLPMLFRMWESINSYVYDDRMLHFLSKLTEMHVSPDVSDPRKLTEIPDDERSEGEQRPRWSREDLKEDAAWQGIYKDVGIFTEHEWGLLMCKCLASMEIPLADTGSLSTAPAAGQPDGIRDKQLSASLARIIVYSMAPDGFPIPFSLEEFLSVPLGKPAPSRGKTYLAGSKALDSLAKLIASTESFFHPSNSGAWTTDLSAFIKYIVYDFNKRWHEEQQSDCKTPLNRRLTRTMKRELVKCLRTVALLAMFSQDNNTVSNIQSCLKSMSVMEPDLILHPVLQRAVPSLEALVETQRTIAVIKALGAVAPAIVSREVYYPGGKYLVPILQLLIPGIDLNDPSKTLCTTAFLVEISQYIKFSDLTMAGEDPISSAPDIEATIPTRTALNWPSFADDEFNDLVDEEPRLSNEDEDTLLKDTTGSFADWVTSFIRRVIQLLENLPEEGPNGSSGGAVEVQVVDAVAGACSQICIHLSEPLFDLVLNMVFDYASTNVRPNAVRAIHQLVECIANADPVKTLARFLPFCSRNIRTELENGASSLRTTSDSMPIPSDATLHWNLAILRGTILKYKDELMSLLQLLHSKTYSKRGYSWLGKMLSSMLLTLTHTYPLENKFVNPDEWKSDEFRWNHHCHWGKLYKPEEIEVSWHVPNTEEVDFALQIFRELVEPALSRLEELLLPESPSHLVLIRNAFAGVPTIAKEYLSEDDIQASWQTSDILDEIPEMLASVESKNAGFCLTNPADRRYQYIRGLRHRFGVFLHNASTSLRQRGEENSVDAVHILIQGFRAYLLEYGDSRDSFFLNEEQFTSEKNVSRQYARQKVWPRAVYVRKARYQHAARLRWNSLERLRGPLEDSLIDDLVEWSVWHYAVIREASQNLLESMCGLYDGVRRRALPALYKSLEPGTDDDRMKGALWTLNFPSFGRYAISEPILAATLVPKLLGCQHNEKPSIQDCVSAVSENCITSFVEPCYLVYDVSCPPLDRAIKGIKSMLPYDAKEVDITNRCRQARIKRVQLMNEAAEHTTSEVMKIATSPRTHWRYEIGAIRCLRTLLRRDMPLTPEQIRFFVERTYHSHPSVYAQRSVMKSLRNLKLRTLCHNPVDLFLARSTNPLKEEIVIHPSRALTSTFLAAYKVPFQWNQKQPIFLDTFLQGWVAWSASIGLYRPADTVKSTFQPWDRSSQEAIKALRTVTADPSYWKNLSTYFSEENHEVSLTQDNVSCVKSIFQVLEDAPFPALKPTLEALIVDREPDKQRAAAELIAGVLGGSKHWPLNKQKVLWAWFKPLIKQIINTNLKSDTLLVWTSFLEYMFYKKDPRRVQPIFDYLLESFMTMDYNAELSFDVVKVLSLFRSCYEELGWKFSAWMDEVLRRCWKEIYSEHEDVRTYIAEILCFADKIKCTPRPTIPTTEVFVKECRMLPVDYDIMGMRGRYHKARIVELVDNFKVWRGERIPGVRAFQSKYDRVGVMVCRWLFESVHDTHAISVFDYILPLMPELFCFTEVNDNDELANRAHVLLVRMCGVTPPRALINPILDAIFEAIKKSLSWRVRLKALPLVQVFYFRQVPLISEAKVVEILEVLCQRLDDEVVEVREMAATTLSGILRLSPRRSVLILKDRFVKLARNSRIPSRQDPEYNSAIRRRHAAILGICALVDSYPYTVEKWMPDLLTNILAEHTYDPIPISTTVRKCASNFKRTHQDTWHEDSKRFDEDQLSALSTLLTGSSYCLCRYCRVQETQKI